MQAAQLQESLGKVERERDSLSEELLQALARVRALEGAAAEARSTAADGEALQEQVDLAMELLGERNARVRPFVWTGAAVCCACMQHCVSLPREYIAACVLTRGNIAADRGAGGGRAGHEDNLPRAARGGDASAERCTRRRWCRVAIAIAVCAACCAPCYA